MHRPMEKWTRRTFPDPTIRRHAGDKADRAQITDIDVLVELCFSVHMNRRDYPGICAENRERNQINEK